MESFAVKDSSGTISETCMGTCGLGIVMCQYFLILMVVLWLCRRMSLFVGITCTKSWGWQTLSIKGQIVNILGSEGHIVSEAATQLLQGESSHRQTVLKKWAWLCSSKAVFIDTEI